MSSYPYSRQEPHLAGGAIESNVSISHSNSLNTSLIYDTFNEFSKFAPIAFDQGSKKGFLIENEKDKRYFSLYGNILFIFDRFEAQSFSNILFLESSSLKKTQNLIPTSSAMSVISNSNGSNNNSNNNNNFAAASNYGISISSFSGKLITLTASSMFERDEWYEAFEQCKYVNMIRTIEDMEIRNIAVDTNTNLHYNQLSALEYSVIGKSQELEMALEKLKVLEENSKALSDKIAELESEKAMLLRAKGIAPKTIPQWASESSSASLDGAGDGGDQIPNMIKIWTGTWNFSNCDPFICLEFSECQKALRPFIPSGYDIYVMCVQECISDSFFDVMEAILNSEGCFRFRGDESSASKTGEKPFNDRLLGKGEGGASTYIENFIGMAIFCKRKVQRYCKHLSSASITFNRHGISSKGAVGIAISVYGRSIAFITSQLDSTKIETRRQQYQQVTYELGGLLSEPGYHLNDVFHHIIWCGDMSFTLVDKSGNALPVENGLRMLEDNFNRTLFESHDQLNFERKVNQLSFYGYREPSPFPNFYPTYKKVKDRATMDYSNKSWVKETYVTKYKESLMKTIEVIPRFSDRILYHSMIDLAEDLIPECVSQEFNVSEYKSGQDRYSANAGKPTLPSALLDNYQSINDGSLFSLSDHSPVCGSFLLRLLHDHEQIRKEVGDHQGNIQSILSALALENNSLKQPSVLSPLSAISTASSDNSSESEVPPVSLTLRPKMKGEIQYESLLPPGPRKIKISNIKLMWGGHEELPVKLKVLFPVCYEAVNGELFVDFSSYESQFDPSRFNEKPGSMSSGSSSPTKNNRLSLSRLSMGGSNKDQAALGNSINYSKKCTWLKSGNTVTKTGIQLEYDATELGKASKQNNIPATQFQWFGSEPLDKLHISIHASLSSTGEKPSNSSSDDSFVPGGESQGLTVGHCSFGLEQLCKTALVASSDLCGSVNIARILLKDGGFPMTRIDPQSDERENVTLCCTVELVA